LFLEVIAAPGYTDDALEVLTKKKNLRVLTIKRPSCDIWEALPVDGGICLQEVDRGFTPESDWTIPTQTKPTPEQSADLAFAWKVVKHVKSNGIVVAKDGVTLGIGTGQPNRVGAVKIAVEGGNTQSAVLASDAFFPFDDAVKAAAAAGISAIIQPGGSVRDADSIKACDEAGIAMVFTGRRHFRH
jgi:phosphoribosylaminoimidazolecarboxamide formyltransferase/IMP cyclohydrolase